MAALASILLIGIHAMVPTVGWLWLVGLGALFALIVALFVLCADLLVGGVDAPSAGALARLGESRKVRRIVRVLTRKWDA
jgi:hypothetical protein